MKSSDDSKFLAGLFSAALSLLFLFVVLGVPRFNTAISLHGNVNLISYAMGVILFCVLYLIFYRIFTLVKPELRLHPLAATILAVLILIGVVCFLAASFLLEGNILGGVTYKYIWHKLPFVLVALLTLIGLLVFLGIWRFQDVIVPGWVWPLYYGGLSILIGYTFYTPNIFGRYDVADTAHGHAYFNSVYNVYYGLPYTENTTSIYGHYGLFYKLPWKLLGGGFTAFILLTAVLGALCFLFSFWALHILCETSILRLMGSFVMTLPILSMRGGYYWQLWPHRILFPALMTLFAAFVIKRQKMNYLSLILGYGISCLAVLWNTESGLCCAIAWAGVWILWELSERRSFLSFLRCGIFQIIGVVFSFFGAYFLVNLYNRLQNTSGNSIREFLFPLLSSDYMTDLLRLDLPLYPSAWIPMVLLFLSGVGIGIANIHLFRSKNESQAVDGKELTRILFIFFLSVLSLGQLTYFINRPAYHNLDICHIPAILLSVILASKGLPSLRVFLQKRTGKPGLTQLMQALFSLVICCTLGVLSAGNMIQYSYNGDIRANFHNVSEMEEFARTIAVDVPPNTYAFGVTAAEIYSILGWATNCYTLDFTDLSLRPQVAEYVVADIKEKNPPAIFVGQATLEKMENFTPEAAQWLLEEYQEVKTYEYGGSTFRFLTKKQ